jgi:hypothetical protein
VSEEFNCALCPQSYEVAGDAARCCDNKLVDRPIPDGGQHEPVEIFDGEWVDIPFNDWSEERLQEGRKTATTRTKRYGDPGDRFRAAGHVYELTHVVTVPLGIVAEQFHDLEGARTTAAFVEVWEDIHYRRGFERDWEVWLHLFREVAHGD